MQWSKKIGSVSGIPIKVHLSMALLAAWLLIVGSNGIDEQIKELSSLLILFSSVALHELGHALMAKRLGVRTRDITLYPFGGIASLIDRINPKQEFLITIAGPMVNVVIASLIFIFFGPDKILQVDFLESALGNLFLVNASLAIFNALPAFPMDGGRILRSSLQLLGVRSATKIAARCSQAVCIGLAVFAFIYAHPILLIIAVFVFYNASRELILGEVQGKPSNLTASQVMVPLSSMQHLTPSLTLEAAAKTVLRSLQSYYPISMQSRILGLVDRETILQKACTSSDPQYITEIMLRDLPCCSANSSLQDLILAFEQHQTPAMLVGTAEDCSGIVFKEQLSDLLVVNEMVRQNLAQRELEQEFGGP
jgi:Zn-dependent protease